LIHYLDCKKKIEKKMKLVERMSIFFCIGLFFILPGVVGPVTAWALFVAPFLEWWAFTQYVVVFWLISGMITLCIRENKELFWNLFGPGVQWYFNIDWISHPKALESSASPRIYCVHPHGLTFFLPIVAFGFLGMRSDVPGHHRKQVRVAVNKWLTIVPGVGWALKMMGCIHASKCSIERALKAGEDVFLFVGGTREVHLSRFGEEHVYVSTRTGFIRLASKCQADVYPVFVFGENDLWDLPTFVTSWLAWITGMLGLRWGSVVIPIGRWYMFVPFSVNARISFGSPLTIPKECNVHEEQARYVKAVQTTFDTYKVGTLCESRELILH